jgi:serine/threonine protein kinase
MLRSPYYAKGLALTQASSLPQPGDVIAGKYRVERALGMGGMGAVFEVTHQVTHKRFAIKWLLPELEDSADAAKRFIREAQVAGRFDHPNVVEVYDLGQEGTASFMVMELLEGESLAARLTRVGRLGAREACEILLPCIEAVAAAHAAGIIHRDLKPANIFLCKASGRTAEHAKVLDFGISKLMTKPGSLDATRTKTGAVMGTPHYMAPEQMRARPIDHRVDVYAFGVTLYELLSGKRPFEAESYAELVIQIAGEPARPLHEVVSDLPAGLEAIVSQAMARNPDARFASVEALMHALEPFCGDMSQHVAAAPAGATRGATPSHREQPQTPLFSESIVEASAFPVASRSAWTWVVVALAGAALTAALVLVGRRDNPSATRTAAHSPGAAPQYAPALDAGEPRPNTRPIERATGPAVLPPTRDELHPNSVPVETADVVAPPVSRSSTAANDSKARSPRKTSPPRGASAGRERLPPTVPPPAAPASRIGRPKIEIGPEDFDVAPNADGPSHPPKPVMDRNGF